jgi:hypothetical protein
MFSIARSRYALLLQFCFFAMNGVGIAVGTIYNASTPDLYENNVHHKMGWIYTLIVAAWILLGIINTYVTGCDREFSDDSSNEYAPVVQNSHKSFIFRRWSDDSGHGTDRQSSICSTHSPVSDQSCSSFHDDDEQYSSMSRNSDDENRNENPRFLRGIRLDKYLSEKTNHVACKTFLAVRIIYTIFERTLIFMAFTAFCTGFVTWGGIFRGSEVFSGLAHFVKGGIFFWIGILAIGRWAGAFADLGWGWNVMPPNSTGVMSSEMVESALICLYGASNVWLEHLTAWGEAWSPMDYDHISITTLFFGGGLLGMLVESKRIRKLLNNSLTLAQISDPENSDDQASTTGAKWAAPDTASTPLNPLPALTILLLGIIMATHTQHSAFAATVHTMWGALFTLAAAFRLCTYLLHYIRPPVSYLPSRPPTELITGFSLVAGGFMFMISPRDITDALESSGADEMVAFVVSMGFTAVICAGVVACMAAKGWAIAHEHRGRFTTMQSQSGAV